MPFRSILVNIRLHRKNLFVIKSSDAELYRCAQAEASKHGAKFVGPATTYKYGIFRLADGREIEIHLYHVRDGRWPKAIDLYLARQVKCRGRNRALMLARLLELAKSGGSRLLDADWAGPHHWYSFEIPDGRVVKIRGSKLVTTGWPLDIDAYLAWSAARCQSSTDPKSKAELFAEFKAAVELNNAVVLSQVWLGARVPHEVLLSDGSVRQIKPNQLKYFGWPQVPLDELRKLVAPFPVHILPDTAGQAVQVFRVTVNGGLYLEGSFAELKTMWGEGAQQQILDALRWADSAGLKLLPTKWCGILADYDFADNDGSVLTRKLPAAAAHEAAKLNQAELAKIRRVGTMHGAKLLSQTFLGKAARYAWEQNGMVISASVKQLIEATRERAKLDRLKQRVADLGLRAVLLSTEWQGMCASYRWRVGDCEITAKLSQLRAMCRNTTANVETADAPRTSQASPRVGQAGQGAQAMAVLRDWAEGVGIKLLSKNWVDPGANYEWALPDGTVVAASLKKVRNCTRAVLRQRSLVDVDLTREHALLTQADCQPLRDRMATSKSR